VAEELVWAYCVADGSIEPPACEGVDGEHPVERVDHAGLTALVSRVPKQEFDADALRRNLNDIEWLGRVARAHEQVLDGVLSATTIVPLRLCTLYESDDGVRQMLEREQSALTGALNALAGREEWGVKLLVDPEKLQQVAASRAAAVAGVQPELDGQSAGGAYLLRRKLERQVREESNALMAATVETLRAGLETFALDMVTRPAQNPELSGLQGRMILNAALLVDADGVDRLQTLARAIEADYGDLGAQVIVTGPWPPYNFVPGSDTAAVA
jgi:Gas vesicle synthesis protein GvpL/GvpF